MQTDLFCNGSDDARSYAPHLDPARVSVVLIDEERDRDHVAAPVDGVLPVGALGNDRAVFVVRVMGKAGDVLHADSFESYRAASNYSKELSATLDRNRQRDIFAEDSAPSAPAVIPAGKASFNHAAGEDLPLFSA